MPSAHLLQCKAMRLKFARILMMSNRLDLIRTENFEVFFFKFSTVFDRIF